MLLLLPGLHPQTEGVRRVRSNRWQEETEEGGQRVQASAHPGLFFGISFGTHKLFVTFSLDFRRSRQSALYKSELQIVALICTIPATFNFVPILSPRLP